jgi:PAS domain S-box-containing protein
VSDAEALDALVAEIRSTAARSRTPIQVVTGYISRSPIAALVADDAGYYVAANDAALALTGFSREELLTRSVTELTAPGDAAVEERLWKSFVRSDHQRGSYALQRKDGATLRVRYDAYASVAPGVHLSFLTRLEGDENQ